MQSFICGFILLISVQTAKAELMFANSRLSIWAVAVNADTVRFEVHDENGNWVRQLGDRDYKVQDLRHFLDSRAMWLVGDSVGYLGFAYIKTATVFMFPAVWQWARVKAPFLANSTDYLMSRDLYQMLKNQTSRPLQFLVQKFRIPPRLVLRTLVFSYELVRGVGEIMLIAWALRLVFDLTEDSIQNLNPIQQYRQWRLTGQLLDPGGRYVKATDTVMIESVDQLLHRVSRWLNHKGFIVEPAPQASPLAPDNVETEPEDLPATPQS